MAKEKTTKKAAKNTGETFDLVIRAPGTNTVSGIIRDNFNKTIMINRKRDGSSKRKLQSIPKENIIFVVGSLTQGENATITFTDTKAIVGRKMRRVAIETSDKETGMLKGINEKGESILINSAFADLETSKETEISGPEEAPKKKKSTKKD